MSMQHAGNADIMDILELARRHCRNLNARNRRTENGPIARVLAFRASIQRQVELLTANELRIAHFLRCVGLAADDAVFDR